MQGISFLGLGFIQSDVLNNKSPTCLKVMCFLTLGKLHETAARLDQQIVVVEFMRRKLAFVFKELQVGWANNKNQLKENGMKIQ